MQIQIISKYHKTCVKLSKLSTGLYSFFSDQNFSLTMVEGFDWTKLTVEG